MTEQPREFLPQERLPQVWRAAVVLLLCIGRVAGQELTDSRSSSGISFFISSPGGDSGEPVDPSLPSTAASSDLASQLKELHQRIEALERTLSPRAPERELSPKAPRAESQKDFTPKVLPPAAGDSSADDTPPSRKPGQLQKASPDPTEAHLNPEVWTDLAGEKWTVKLGGHVQADYVNWARAAPAIQGDQDYFEFRRLRLVADGQGYGVFDFRLQFTLEPETISPSSTNAAASPDVKDAYFTMHEIPCLGRFRIGNFFVPFSLEQVTNDTNNIFMERSIPTQGIFAADREVGVALYNASWDERITWTVGAFFDSISEGIKERIDDNQGYRLSGRFTFLPYFDRPSKGRYLLHLGAGILHTDDQDKQVRFRARPQVHEGPRLIDSGLLPADRYTTGNVEWAWVHGPVTVQGEVFLSSVPIREVRTELLHGAYVHLSYFLTGENRVFDPFGQHGAQFGRNVPLSNFFLVPGGYGPGGWEFKLRWSHLNLNEINRGTYHDVTAGFNWYWSDRTRVMFDWIHPFTSADTVFGSSEADLLAMRFDFNW